jgi:hypothetical protein
VIISFHVATGSLDADILAARTYALYGCSKNILALLVSTSGVGIIISCVCPISLPSRCTFPSRC